MDASTVPAAVGVSAVSRLGELFEQAAIGLAVFSPEGVLVRSNPAFDRLLDQDGKELAGHHLLDLVAKEDSTLFAEKFAGLGEGRTQSLVLEHRLVSRDGSLRWVHSVASRLRDSQGAGQETVLAVTDIGARVRAENARDDLFENTNDLIQSIAADGSILYVNRAWRETLGYAADEIPTLNIFQVIAPESVPHCSLIWENLMGGANVGLVEMVFATKNGRRVALQGNLSVRTEAGQVVSTRGIFRDVSEAKEARDKLAAALAKLELRNTELKQFAYIAAHDLQEPLRAISGFSKLLVTRHRDQLDHQGVQYLDLVCDGAERMKQLLDALLKYTSTAEADMVLAYVDSGEALDRALANLTTVVAQSGAAITRDELPKVKADTTLLSTVFQNLVSNAIKFCGDKPPAIHVTAAREGPAWRFSVRDQGIGFDPEFAGRIFGLFQRLHTRDKYAGTGLGLAICQQAVERQGGHIWAESALGAGSTFHFTIPD